MKFILLIIFVVSTLAQIELTKVRVKGNSRNGAGSMSLDDFDGF